MSIENPAVEWLWLNFSPLLIGFFLIAAILAATTVGAFVARTTSRRYVAICLAFVVGIGCFSGLALAWTTGVIAPSLPATRFDSARWQSQPWQRSPMAASLIGSQSLQRRTRTQVVNLLGEPDGSFAPTAESESWVLWRPADAITTMWPELVVYFDEQQRVVSCEVEGWY